MSDTLGQPLPEFLRMPGCKRNGFSLIEVVFAMAVMGLLLGSLIVPLAAQRDMRARRETDKALAEIRDALIGYAVVKGRLPCPAPATAAAGTAVAGNEAYSGNNCLCAGASAFASANGADCSTSTVVGVVPWATLGVAETDAWGRRYTYSIDTQFGRKTGQMIVGCAPNAPPTYASFALCSPSSIEIRTAVGGPFAVGNNVPAIVVSHGKNGWGGYSPQGNALSTADASADEQENADGNPVFVSNTNSDDQVVWISSYILMNRMLAANMLP